MGGCSEVPFLTHSRSLTNALTLTHVVSRIDVPLRIVTEQNQNNEDLTSPLEKLAIRLAIETKGSNTQWEVKQG